MHSLGSAHWWRVDGFRNERSATLEAKSMPGNIRCGKRVKLPQLHIVKSVHTPFKRVPLVFIESSKLYY